MGHLFSTGQSTQSSQLKRSNHLDHGWLSLRNTVLQGRVACEVNSGDELAATELIFGGVLTQLTPEEAVAVLSALVFQVPIGASHLCCQILQFVDVLVS